MCFLFLHLSELRPPPSSMLPLSEVKQAPSPRCGLTRSFPQAAAPREAVAWQLVHWPLHLQSENIMWLRHQDGQCCFPQKHSCWIWFKQVSQDWNVTQQCLCAHNPRSQFVQLFFSAYWVSWCSRISFLYWMYILWPQQPAQFQAYITISCCLTRFFNCVS